MKNCALTALVIFIMCIAAHSAMVEPEEAVFPRDTELEWCVRNHLDNPYAPTLYLKDLENITYLNCDKFEVTSLEGIEQLVNLETLNMGLAGTPIVDLEPLAVLVNLKRLEIPRSEIEDITPLAELFNLEYLNFAENHITDLEPLRELTNLKTLILYWQSPDYITDITPLDNLTRMVTLNLESNKITDITPLASMKNLSYLHMRDNRLTSLEPLEELENLKMVNFNLNILTDLTPLLSSQGLTAIYARNNRLTSVEFVPELPNLTVLDLSQNLLTDVKPIGEMFRPALIALDLNQITDISSFKRIIRDGFLKELGLSYNCIENINRMSLYLITNVRDHHQCETHPLPTEYDLLTVVNGDLLASSPSAVDGEEPDENIIENLGPSGPGGCSAAGGNPWGDLLLIIICGLLGAAIKIKSLSRRR